MTNASAAAREVRFEVATLRDGRWLIECARLGESEARSIAARLLATNAYEAVRVVRERDLHGRTLVETPVFAARRPGTGEPALRVSATDERDCWCTELDDLYGARSRRAIGQLLRSLLDQLGITPGELLYNPRFARKLDDAGTLLGSALHRIARARAEATGETLAASVRLLETLIAAALRRMAEAQADRRASVPGEDGLDAHVARCRARAADPAMARFLVRHGMARVLETCPSLLARLDAALRWQDGADDPDSLAAIDEFVADCLGSAAVMQEALGAQPDLATALRVTIEIARGRFAGQPPRAAPWFPSLARLLAEQACPEIRLVLLARVQRELGGERPLTRGGGADEANAITAIVAALKDDRCGGYVGGSLMLDGIVRRWKRLDRPGGLGEIEIPSGPAAERFGRLLAMEPECFGETRKRALATLLLDAVRDVPAGERGALAAFAPAIRASGLLEAARAALLGELAAAG